MTEAFIQSLLQQGEGLKVEFKESFSGLNRDTFESICAFLNRKGGHLVLGVTNEGKVEGVLDADALKMAIITDSNNPQKLHPVFPLSPEIINYDSKQVIYVYVPESSMVHATAGKTFDRRGDADLDISRQQSAITELHLRKQQSFTENRVYPYLRLEDLRPDLIDRARKLARGNRPGHPWLEMSDEELLRSAGLHQRDYAAGTEGYTLAAALLFGKDEVILSIVPAYKTDAILRIKNLDRYDDRDMVQTNLIEAYDRLMAFIAKHLPDPFFQGPDATRVSLRDKIFREVIANMLVHREYASHYPARLVITRDAVTAENWNKPHGQGFLKPESFTPYTKNPVLARFFREIGRMDELGSGVRNLFRYGPLYASGRVPEVVEEDLFKVTVPIDPLEVANQVTNQVANQVANQDGDATAIDTDRLRKILPTHVLKDNIALWEALAQALLAPNFSTRHLDKYKHLLNDFLPEWKVVLENCFTPLSRKQILVDRLALTNQTYNFRNYIAPLLEFGLLARTIPDKPKSQFQKYFMTEKGKIVLHLLEEQEEE